MAGFGDCIADMDAVIMASLSDGEGEFIHPDGQIVRNVPLMLDHNLQINGPEGLYRSDAVGVTWRRQSVPCAVGRGGIFVFRKRRYLVEGILIDDGHMVTAACMEQR
ncbi:MAG: hypothetical protein OZ926_14755 [Pseudomonas sp.]|uniref:hypothetical protein n=1 Tax=Stutzerimonas degradans TaxID=2968968 RepID=UPI00141F2CE0|nr:hypothetical protein [Stutzerimonas degradans]MEB2328100.1 hypothetical protein [Pseudomonas sp.]NHW01932.1 hypothetical protein [Stutzerimonas degradans]